jgi:hypothetical protein
VRTSLAEREDAALEFRDSHDLIKLFTSTSRLFIAMKVKRYIAMDVDMELHEAADECGDAGQQQ